MRETIAHEHFVYKDVAHKYISKQATVFVAIAHITHQGDVLPEYQFLVAQARFFTKTFKRLIAMCEFRCVDADIAHALAAPKLDRITVDHACDECGGGGRLCSRGGL